jgi:hypothetical protein
MAHLHCNLNQLPPYLYRIQQSDSLASFSSTGDLEAEDITSYFDNEDQFRLAILDSFTWSCFIKVFSDKQYAERWALQRGNSTRQECEVITIDSSKLVEGRVFRLADLVDGLELEVPKGDRARLQRAYLCFRRIPAESIFCRRKILPGKRARKVPQIVDWRV